MVFTDVIACFVCCFHDEFNGDAIAIKVAVLLTLLRANFAIVILFTGHMPHCLFARTSVRADSLLVQLLAARGSQLMVRASGGSRERCCGCCASRSLAAK